MAKSDNLRKAKEGKNDEFYTRLEDIEAEISSHPDYVKQFEGKTVFCNCDDPEWSSFFEFFRLHFHQLRMKKLITTHFNLDGSPSYKLEWEGEMLNDDPINLVKTPLEGNGDFRSNECIELLKESDIVCSNPPFSLWREYIAQIIKYEKHFIIIGSQNAIAYKEVFPLLKDNKIWLGYGFNDGNAFFKVPDGNGEHYAKGVYDPETGLVKFRNCAWFTNLDIDKRHEPLPLNKNYKGNETRFPHYDNYDAIDCNRIADIPKDYYGPIGVPITFMDKYCPEQFRIIGSGSGNMAKQIGVKKNYRGRTDLAITENGKSRCPYNRIIIQRIRNEEEKGGE